MTPALVAQLRQQKEEIIAFLRRSMQTLPTNWRRFHHPLRRANEPLPLSFAQERLWLLDQLNSLKVGKSAAYNMPAALHLQGRLDRAALVASLNELIRRHEILRTTFPAVDGAPVQSIAASATLDLPQIDLQSVPPELRDRAQVKQAMQDEATRAF